MVHKLCNCLAATSGPFSLHQFWDKVVLCSPTTAEKEAALLRNPCILGGTQQRRQNQKWLPLPYPFRAQKEGRIATYPCILKVPQQRGQNQNRCLTPAFSGGHKWLEVLHDHRIRQG